MNGDELILRIVPELDQNAKKQVEDDLNTITGNIPIGGKGKGSDPETSARKERLADYRAEIDLIDLTLRKTTSASQRRTQLLEQEAAQGKRSLQETAQLLAQEESIRANATAEAIRGYDLLGQELDQLGSSQQDVINRQKQLFFASERAKNGFTTMSGSMTTLTSNTKSANIAFANFGRIVQDAPFGLLGISNNIDPLLNSFSQLKQETGSTGLALKAMGAQLLGPAGLIFLVGSALPTALLFLQRHLQDTKKEADGVTDAVKSLQEQISKGFAEAAAQMGIDELNAGLSVATFRLEQEEKKLEDVKRQMTEYAFRGMAMTEADRERGRALRDNQAQIEKNIEREKENVKQFETEIALLKTREENEALYSRNSIGRAKSDQDKRKDDLDNQKKIEENNRRLIQQFAELDVLMAFQNESVEESRQAYLKQQEAIRLANEEKFRARLLELDEPLTRDDTDAVFKQAEALEQLRIDALRAAGKEEQAITLETERAKREERLRLVKLGITDAETLNSALAVISKEGADRIKDNELTIADARSESMAIYADAVASGLGAIFGENKAIQSAQVVVDTYAGAQKAFAALAPNLPLQIAASGAVIAQGIATLRKINSTQKGTKSIGRTASQASPTPSGPQFVNDLGVAGQVAGTITPFGASMSPSISITANLDRQGLALAVRDGEADIATRQIPFAS